MQKAPQLFEQIKIMCDESGEKGLFWLAGSQQFNMMKNVRETLAGRIGILKPYQARISMLIIPEGRPGNRTLTYLAFS